MPRLARVSYPIKVVAVGARLLCGCSGIQVVSVLSWRSHDGAEGPTWTYFLVTNEQRFLVGRFSLDKLYLVKCWHRDLGVAVYLVRESGQALWNVKPFFDVLFGEGNRSFQQVHEKMQRQLPILWGQIFPDQHPPANFYVLCLNFYNIENAAPKHSKLAKAFQ